MPTIVGILTFISMINTTSEILKAKNFFICRYLRFYEQLKFCTPFSWAWKKLYNTVVCSVNIYINIYIWLESCFHHNTMFCFVSQLHLLNFICPSTTYGNNFPWCFKAVVWETSFSWKQFCVFCLPPPTKVGNQQKGEGHGLCSTLSCKQMCGFWQNLHGYIWSLRFWWPWPNFQCHSRQHIEYLLFC